MVGFWSIGGWCYSEWWVWDLRKFAQFQGSEISLELLQDFMDGYIKPEHGVYKIFFSQKLGQCMIMKNIFGVFAGQFSH